MADTPKITIRDYTLEDIIAQDKYLEEASDEYLLRLGVDPTKIRGTKTDIEAVQKNLSKPIKDRQGHNYAIEVDGKTIGIAVVKKIQYGVQADLHAHIFNLENRNQGIASQIFLEIIKRAFETFDVKILICEPSVQNPAPNKLLQKMGLKIISTFTSPAQGILLERTANRYEITRELLKNLSK